MHRVIIAAKNEEELIGTTLSKLNASIVEPCIVVNGSNDKTAEIARRYTSNVIDLSQSSKMRALQIAVGRIGHLATKEPILFIDADSWPCFPSSWADEMTRHLKDDQTGHVAGPFMYSHGGNGMSNMMRSLRRIQEARNEARSGSNLPYGVNMAVKFNDETLERFMSLENYWPGEDRAIRDLFVDGRSQNIHQCLSVKALVLTSGRYLPSLLDRFTKGARCMSQEVRKEYIDRGPDDAKPYTPL